MVTLSGNREIWQAHIVIVMSKWEKVKANPVSPWLGVGESIAGASFSRENPSCLVQYIDE